MLSGRAARRQRALSRPLPLSSRPVNLAEVLLRALELLLLAAAPTSSSPEPLPPAGLPLWGGAALVVLFFALLGRAALAFRRGLGTRAAAVAASLALVTLATALGAAVYFSGARAPLGQGTPFVAVPLWALIGAVGYALAEKRFGRGAAGLVLALALAGGAVETYRAVELSRLPRRMWWTALYLEPSHDRAGAELVRPYLRSHRFDDAKSVVDQCLAQKPAGCACLDQRTRVALAAGDLRGVVGSARRTLDACPGYAPAAVTMMEALVAEGDFRLAEQEARAALVQAPASGRLHYALAQALDRLDRPEDAAVEARLAIQLGWERDPSVYLAARLIKSGDLDGAAALLDPLIAADPDDADARYDRALVAERRNDFAKAREGYLATLAIDPKQLFARYNVALLSWRTGAAADAQYHLERFRASFPGDPRGDQLARILASKPPSR